MDQAEIERLIAPAITPGKYVWADLGSGEGNFTLALRKLAGPEVTIYSVDSQIAKLREQEQHFAQVFPGTKIKYLEQDFTDNVVLPLLDGIMMANSLHFVRRKNQFLESLTSMLKPGGKLLIIEYDTDSGNSFVPYPVTFSRLSKLLRQHDFSDPQLIGTAPSKYQKGMYAAVATWMEYK